MPRGQELQPLAWPTQGMSVHGGFSAQPPGTTVDCLNVRGYDPSTNRLRGAQRCGHSKYVAAQCNGANFIQSLEHISLAQAASNAAIRQLKGVAVAGGTIKGFTAAGGFTATSGGAGALSATSPYIGTAILFSKVYYADGSHWIVYDPSTDTASAWTASAGSLPVDGSGRTPRLICTWRGRIVLAGIIGDPTNWFMSAQFDATNFDYSPQNVTATQAVAGNNTEAGQVPDNITTLMPYSDDLLIFGGDHSIWQMTEDPAAGGQIDRISDTVGVAFGLPWCKDAFGNIYFWGSRGGFYGMHPTPGATAAPVRLSAQNIDELLLDVDMTQNIVRMVWDDRFQSVMTYITPINGGSTTHWVYDTRNEAFYQDQFNSDAHNPTAVHLMDGDSPTDRVVLLGCRDGYIRKIDTAAKDDDGQLIKSYVYFGPFLGGDGKLRLRELRGILGESSDPVTLEVFSGHSAEAAHNSSPAHFGTTLSAGKSYAMRAGAVAQAIYIKLSNQRPSKSWQFEMLYAGLEGTGLPAGRGL